MLNYSKLEVLFRCLEKSPVNCFDFRLLYITVVFSKIQKSLAAFKYHSILDAIDFVRARAHATSRVGVESPAD